ncbi:hypothetical protein UlMin_005908 [Ulmus minor]
MEDSHLKDKKMDGVRSRRLSLIDVSSEDDSLIGLVPAFLQDDQSASENQEQRSVELFESGANQLVDFDDTLKQKEQVPQPSECAEPIRKHNLRNSFSWNSAFFTCEGVLDDEELASINTVKKGEKHVLPEIQEEVHRSTDSISTLESDTSMLESSKAFLFEDVRASIQKSRKATNSTEEKSEGGSGVRETKASCISKRGNLASQDKMKPKVAPNKPSIIIQNPQKLVRQVSASPQIPQSLAGSRESASSLFKQPKVLEKPSSISTTAAKRASLSGNPLKTGKNNVKMTAVRGASVSKLPSSSRVPRPALPSKSSSLSSSTATSRESTFSFESSGSTSSLKFGTSPSNSTKKRTDFRTGNISTSPNSNPKAPSRVVVKNKSQPGKSKVSAHLMPSSKLSASTSSASSISDWSSESVSSISSLQQISCSSRESFNRSSCKRIPIDCDAPHVSASQNHRDDESSVGQESQVSGLVGQCALRASTAMGGLPPVSKPSGLRLPSPKIGFFDGVRTPKRGGHSHPLGPSNLPKVGAGNVSLSGGANGGQIEAKGGKVTDRTVTLSPNPDSQQTSSNTKDKLSARPEEASKAKVRSASKNVGNCRAISPKVKTVTLSPNPDAQQTSSNTKDKLSTRPEEASKATVHSASKNVENCRAISPKVKSEMPLNNVGESYSKAEVDVAGLHVKDSGFAEKKETTDGLLDKVTREVKDEMKLSPTPLSDEHTAISVI